MEKLEGINRSVFKKDNLDFLDILTHWCINHNIAFNGKESSVINSAAIEFVEKMSELPNHPSISFESFKKQFEESFGKVTPQQFIKEMESVGCKFSELKQNKNRENFARVIDAAIHQNLMVLDKGTKTHPDLTVGGTEDLKRELLNAFDHFIQDQPEVIEIEFDEAALKREYNIETYGVIDDWHRKKLWKWVLGKIKII